ncbi:MAG: hypothetical protein K1X86_15985 [Ignavibacteria bacterium]|nr:hypothetical protein [Ignavibacteria bacterium]
MNPLKFLLIFILINFSNLYAQTNYKDNIADDKSKYAGVYEGNLDLFQCCDVVEMGYGTISFYFTDDTLKCLYDGNIAGKFLPKNNVLQNIYEDMQNQIFGKFVISNGTEGFLYYFENGYDHPDGSTSFLKKIGDAEMARNLYLDAENELNEFNIFEIKFRAAFANRNDKDLLTMINYPFYYKAPFNDGRKNNNPEQYNNPKEIFGLMKQFNKTTLFEGSKKYQNATESYGGYYTIQGDKMFFYFKKIGSEFKMVFVTGVFG